MIWFVAAVGVAAGAGMYMLATLSTCMATFIVLILDTPYGLKGRVYYTLKLTMKVDDLNMESLLERLRSQKKIKVKANGMVLDRENDRVAIDLMVGAKSDVQHLSIQESVIKLIPEALTIDLRY